MSSCASRERSSTRCPRSPSPRPSPSSASARGSSHPRTSPSSARASTPSRSPSSSPPRARRRSRPAQILERLSQRLDLLKGGRDADPRQQTLRATIEWSYDLLSPEEQQLFARLSVFAGGCTLEAAEEVCDADLDTLQSLVEKSLLRFTDERYWMLETIREYAGEALTKRGKAEELAQRHLHYFLELAETAEPELWAQHTDDWLPRLDPEEANFRTALGHAVAGDEAEVAVRLAGSIYPFWEIRARHREARAWLERALALGGAVPPSDRAKALVAAGRATSWQSDWPTAIPVLEEAIELSRELDDVQGVGRCLGFIGHARLYTGDTEGAAAALDEGVQLARSTGDRLSIARALYNAAWAAIEQRDFDRAREMFDEANRIARAEGMKPNLALGLMRLGYTEALAGNFERAASSLDESVVLVRRARQDDVDTGRSPLPRSSRAPEREDRRGGVPTQGKPDWRDAMKHRSSIFRTGSRGWPRSPPRTATLSGRRLSGERPMALFERLGLAPLEENRQVRALFRDTGGITRPRTLGAWPRDVAAAGGRVRARRG